MSKTAAIHLDFLINIAIIIIKSIRRRERERERRMGISGEPLELEAGFQGWLHHFLAMFIGQTPNLSFFMCKIEGTIVYTLWAYE